jgi:DnaK suppressor protein
MNKRDLEKFQKLLLKHREKLSREYENIEHKIDTPSDSFAYPYHMADVGTDTAEKEEESIIITNIGNTLILIDEALEKIENNTYGKCERCSKKIEKARLKVLPYAKLCIKCQELEEKMGGR